MYNSYTRVVRYISSDTSAHSVNMDKIWIIPSHFADIILVLSTYPAALFGWFKLSKTAQTPSRELFHTWDTGHTK